MAPKIYLDNTGSGKGLISDGTKSLPEQCCLIISEVLLLFHKTVTLQVAPEISTGEMGFKVTHLEL